MFSLSLLRTRERNLRFLFLLSKLEKGIQVSLSPLETGQENSRFLFLLSRRGKGIRISLSPLECGEIVFKFLFLFSIGLFCISSMTVYRNIFILFCNHMILYRILIFLHVLYISNYLNIPQKNTKCMDSLGEIFLRKFSLFSGQARDRPDDSHNECRGIQLFSFFQN